MPYGKWVFSDQTAFKNEMQMHVWRCNSFPCSHQRKLSAGTVVFLLTSLSCKHKVKVVPDWLTKIYYDVFLFRIEERGPGKKESTLSEGSLWIFSHDFQSRKVSLRAFVCLYDFLRSNSCSTAERQQESTRERCIISANMCSIFKVVVQIFLVSFYSSSVISYLIYYVKVGNMPSYGSKLGRNLYSYKKEFLLCCWS